MGFGAILAAYTNEDISTLLIKTFYRWRWWLLSVTATRPPDRSRRKKADDLRKSCYGCHFLCMYFSFPLLATSRYSADKGKEQYGNKDAGHVGVCRHRAIGAGLQPVADNGFSNSGAVEHGIVY